MTWISRGIEGETFFRLADYDTHRQEIEEAAMMNPYPFKKWFAEGDRVYIPLVGDDRNELSVDDWGIITDLKDAGYTVDENLYIQGYAIGRNGNKVRIGKVLNKIIEDNLAKEKQQIMKSTQETVDNLGYDPEMAEDEMQERISVIEKYYGNMKNKFINSPARTGSGDRLMVAISQNPHDIGMMSTDRGWTSCMNLDTGAYRENVVCEVAAGSLVAYVIRADDMDIEKPLARIHIKRYADEEGNSYALPEDSVYGSDVENFYNTVKSWLQERQGDLPMGFYRRKGGNYSDSLEENLFVFPDDIETLKDIALNGIDNPMKFVIWRLTPTHMMEGYVSPDDFEEEDEEIGLYTDFAEERDAMAAKKNLESYYRDEWEEYIKDEYYDEDDEEDESPAQLFQVEKVVLKSEEDIMNEALDKIIDEYGMENVPDEIIEAKKNSIEYESRYKAFLKRMYYGGKRHLMEEGEIASVKADKDYAEKYAKDIANMQDGSEKESHIKSLVSDTNNDLDWILTSPQETKPAYNSPADFHFIDRYESILKAFNRWIFNVDRQIPQESIQKMIAICNDYERIHEIIYGNKITLWKDDERGTPEGFRERLVSGTLLTLGLAGTDTPLAIRWYDTLMDDWKPEWENIDKPHAGYSKINVDTMGRAISALGPDNGAKYIPFIRKRAQEAAKVYSQIPKDHKNSYIKNNMKRIYDSYMTVLKNISSQSQASTWAARYASDMGLWAAT